MRYPIYIAKYGEKHLLLNLLKENRERNKILHQINLVNSLIIEQLNLLICLYNPFFILSTRRHVLFIVNNDKHRTIRFVLQIEWYLQTC